MTVRIEEMSHIPAPVEAALPAASSAAAPQAESIGTAMVVAAIRREHDRRARLWAD